MKHFWLACLAIVLPQLANAQENRCNQTNHRCDSERYDQTEYRTAPPVTQPYANPVQTPCQGQTPASQSYRIQINAVTCGEGAVGHDRLPLPIAKPVMDRWEVLRGGQRTDAREVMQEIRQQDVKYRGTIEFPMYESWTYQEKTGGFNSYHCGNETYQTTCSRNLEELVTTRRQVDGQCLRYEELPDDPPPSSNTGGGGYGGGYSAPSAPGGFDNRGSSAPTGSGESSSDLRGKSEDRMNRYPNGAMKNSSDPKRGLAKQGRCLEYEKVWKTEENWVSRGTVNYSCSQQRAQYCQWFETRTVQRRCPNVSASYQLEFAKDPNWKPDMKVSSNPLENYNDLLPNKFDLLPGESEEVYAYSNTGVSTSLRPSIKIENKWNNYRFQAGVRDGECRFGMKPALAFRVHTLSRIKRKAPNPLALPRDAQGKMISPFKFEPTRDAKGRVLQGRPLAVSLQDNSRAMILAASEITRTFPAADASMKGATANDSIQKRAVDTSQVGTALTNGFWADTQFKIRMIRLDKWGREVKMTDDSTINSNQADIFRDSLVLDLQGKNGAKPFYRPATIIAPILGALKTKKDIELSPGKEYVMKLQVAQRGLPWYESGCKGGKSTCEGQVAEDRAFSEPMLIKFTYDENARRSLGQWIHDIREFFLVF